MIKATASTMDLASQGQDATPRGSPTRASASAAARSPLIPKKAGLRSHGPLFLSHAKTWWAGMALVVVSFAVFAVTLLTAGGGAGH